MRFFFRFTSMLSMMGSAASLEPSMFVCCVVVFCRKRKTILLEAVGRSICSALAIFRKIKSDRRWYSRSTASHVWQVLLRTAIRILSYYIPKERSVFNNPLSVYFWQLPTTKLTQHNPSAIFQFEMHFGCCDRDKLKNLKQNENNYTPKRECWCALGRWEQFLNWQK